MGTGKQVSCPACGNPIIGYGGFRQLRGAMEWTAECCLCGLSFVVVEPDGGPAYVKAESRKEAREVVRRVEQEEAKK